MDFEHLPDFAERPSKRDSFHAVLVVDDDRMLAQALHWILADQSFLVDKAFDGEEALLKVKAHDYDAVVCDIMMPRLRGDEFYRSAVELRPVMAERFIFITTFGADPAVQNFLTESGARYLEKPFEIRKLIDCVREVIARKTVPPRGFTFSDSDSAQ
jgi:DNA-binding response OmpR family regulator